MTGACDPLREQPLFSLTPRVPSYRVAPCSTSQACGADQDAVCTLTACCISSIQADSLSGLMSGAGLVYRLRPAIGSGRLPDFPGPC